MKKPGFISGFNFLLGNVFLIFLVWNGSIKYRSQEEQEDALYVFCDSAHDDGLDD
jgi:hypothetical protein